MMFTFEVKIVALPSTICFSLTYDDSLKHFLSELGFTLFDTSKEHVSYGTTGQTVEPSTAASSGDHIQVLSSSVICAVQHRGNWQTVRDLDFNAVASSSS